MISKGFLIVAYTEYQQLQAEAIIDYYGLEDCHLLIPSQSRVSIINENLFSSVQKLEGPSFSSFERLTITHYHRFQKRTKALYGNIFFRAIIGAADDNIDFAILRKTVNHHEYWNIEDGMANYTYPEIPFILKGLTKKLIFNFIFFKNVDLRIHIGNGRSAKCFRMMSKLTTNKIKGEVIDVSNIIKQYFEKYRSRWDDLFTPKLLEVYGRKEKVLVLHKDVDDKYDVTKQKILVKPHPKHGYNSSSDDYIDIPLPIEVLPILLPNIKTYIYQEYLCTSMLNLLALYEQTEIVIDFDIVSLYRRHKSAIRYFTKLQQHFGKRILSQSNP